jgi:hypothetical protein
LPPTRSRYGDAIPTAALLSFRLGGPDGVSVEAAKWQRALTDLGFATVTVAGSGAVDHLLPGLSIGPRSHRCDRSSSRHWTMPTW